MKLEATSRHCCSRHYLLRLDGRPTGEFRGRWFSEGLEVRGTGRQHWNLEKAAWFGSQFSLKEGTSGEVLARGTPAGWLTSSWDLELGDGPARLVSRGILSSGYRIERDDRVLGEVRRLGACTPGWVVETEVELRRDDLLFIGLIFHVILARQSDADGGGG